MQMTAGNHMTEFTAIAPESHAKKVWKNVPDYAFAAADTVIPLMGAELSKTISAMPTGFIKREFGYQLVGITSLQAGMNMYVAPDGKWLTGYIPTMLRAYPFGLAEHEGPDKTILCINEASGLVVESTEDGNAFFDDQNQPTQETKDILNLLSDFRVNLEVTQRAVNALDDAGLIIPWALKTQQGEEVVPVAKLFNIDEAALNKLDDDDFLALRKANGLAVAYAQLLSMNQLIMLEGLGQLRGQTLARQTDNSKATNLAGISLLEENGSLVFD
jgi:hypothetical protein